MLCFASDYLRDLNLLAQAASRVIGKANQTEAQHSDRSGFGNGGDGWDRPDSTPKSECEVPEDVLFVLKLAELVD